MKKFSLLIAAVFVLLQTLSAREISVSEAQSVAERFSATNSLLKSKRNLPLNLAYVERAQDLNCVYVFSRGTENGYVVVSGDDRAFPVLGYADNGTFDAENLPENAKWWLGEYARQIQYLNEKGIDCKASALTKNLFQNEVKPLLTSKWNQDAPYNNLCPMNNGARSVVGCAATAASQIMYYHKWPKQGTGSITYKWINGGQNISANFSNVVFDWDNMKDSYGPSNTAAEKEAVAELCYYVGVGSQMNYSSTASGATTVATSTALFKYFGYDEGMEQISRDVTSHAEWVSKIVTELDNQRPIFYSGTTGDRAGHAFVFDGYNKDGYFHVNWGWGGMSDGYFLIDALDPNTHGIGGADAGFNYGQSATIGIQPKDNKIKYNPNLFVNGDFVTTATSANKGGKVTFGLDGFLILNGIDKTNFTLGIGIYNSSNELVYSLFQMSGYSLSPGYAYNPVTLAGMTMPSEIADGNYKLFPVVKFGNDPEVKIVNAPLNFKRYVGVKVEGSTIYFNEPQTVVLNVETLTPAGKILNDALGSFSAVVANNCEDDYYNFLGLDICDKSTLETVQDFTPVIAALSPGEKATFVFEGVITAAAGDYTLILYDTDGNVLRSMDITVEPAAEKPALTLTQKSEILSIVGTDEATGLPLVNGNDIRYRAYLNNTGGYYSGYLNMRIWKAIPRGNATQWEMVEEHQQTGNLDKNESKTVNYEVSTVNLVPGNKYRCSIFNGDNEIRSGYGRVMFIATDKTGGVDAVESANIAVYPNPVEETLNVTAPADVKSVEIYSLLGTKVVDVKGDSSELNINVSHLLPSAYIVVVTAEDGSRLTRKIIKK